MWIPSTTPPPQAAPAGERRGGPCLPSSASRAVRYVTGWLECSAAAASSAHVCSGSGIGRRPWGASGTRGGGCGGGPRWGPRRHKRVCRGLTRKSCHPTNWFSPKWPRGVHFRIGMAKPASFVRLPLKKGAKSSLRRYRQIGASNVAISALRPNLNLNFDTLRAPLRPPLRSPPGTMTTIATSAGGDHREREGRASVNNWFGGHRF